MEALFSNVLTASVHGSIVIAAVLLLRLALKKAPKKYICLLWLLAGVRLLMPFEIQSELSLQPDTDVQWQGSSGQGEVLFAGADLYVPETLAAEQEEADWTEPVVHRTPVRKDAEEEEPAASVRPAPAAKTGSNFDWAMAAPVVWLAVASGFVVSSVVSYLRLKRKVRYAVRIPGGWECESIETAFILGFLKPQIYIPMGMSPKNRRYILEHERTHLDKGDHWFKMIGFIALALHWFNPLVWVAYVLLCKDIEMACDERVVQFMELEERKEYSTALLECSTNRAHFAACPVAFGEVSVKERIMTVLNYKKPGFWISLVSVIAIVFVAVCLLTNPANTPEEPMPIGETEAAAEPLFSGELTDEEMLEICTEAFQTLKNQETLCVQVQFTADYGEEGTYSTVETCRRQGENALLLSEGDAYKDGRLTFEGRNAWFLGDFWTWNSNQTDIVDVDGWLDRYSPEGKEISFPEGTGQVSGNTLVFHGEWDSTSGSYHYSGTFAYTFREDGSLASLTKEYTGSGDDGRFTETLTVLEESGEETYAAIKAVADQVLTLEEVEEYRLLQELVTEVPSNKTDYDKDYALGSATMGWRFMKGQWFFKFGAENITNTGLKLVVECSMDYDYEGDTGLNGTVTAGPEYFLEQLVDGVWVTVQPTAKTFTPISEKTLSAGGSQTINWENNYGQLDAGFYRIGNYYTFTSDSGETDTQVCYAKFRVYDPNHDALLKQCRSGLEKLLTGENYHILCTDWLVEYGFDYYLVTEGWKSGEDLLEVNKYPLKENGAEMKNVRGSMWRDGKFYGLTWEGEAVESGISQWWVGVDGYVDDSSLNVWALSMEFYDSSVELVYQEGNDIHILGGCDFNNRYQYTERVFRFDDQGSLTGIEKAYLPSLNCEQGQRVIALEMTVQNTGAEKTRQLIDAQDVSGPGAFSYAEDQENNPDMQTEGFRNTGEAKVENVADAIALAKKECTLPAIMEFQEGYLQIQVSHDDAAEMWKVELFWWQDDDCYQAVYLNDQGVTQGIVTGRKTVE